MSEPLIEHDYVKQMFIKDFDLIQKDPNCNRTLFSDSTLLYYSLQYSRFEATEILLNRMGIPDGNLDLKQRLALYQLLGET